MAACCRSDIALEAVEHFEKNYRSAITIACAISLASYESRLITKVLATINWRIFQVKRSEYVCEINKWQALMVSRGLSVNEALNLRQEYLCWLRFLEDASADFMRWLCHGHIGWSVLWNMFAAAVVHATGDPSDAGRVLQMGVEQQFNVATEIWLAGGGRDRPSPVLVAVGLAP
jgi:hypothetical protein